MSRSSRWILWCCVGLIAALWAVGIEASQPLRHLVQTAPIWIGVVFAARKSPVAKWAALPFFIIWLCLMGLIWLYLLGLANVITGSFSPIEIVLTGMIGLVSVAGIVSCLGFKSRVPLWTATAVFLLSAVLQFAAVRLSFIPEIARR